MSRPGGAWCQLDLIYNVSDDEEKKRPFYIRALKPIQVAAFDDMSLADWRRRARAAAEEALAPVRPDCVEAFIA